MRLDHTHYLAKHVMVRLDGTFVEGALSADDEAGWVEHLVKDKEGRWEHDGREVRRTTRYGKVVLIDKRTGRPLASLT